MNVHSHSNILGIQHLLLLVRFIHQSMPIVVTLSIIELRETVPNVGVIQLVLFPSINIFTVMAHDFNWLIPTLDKSNIRPLTVIGGLLIGMENYCSYFPPESP